MRTKLLLSLLVLSYIMSGFTPTVTKTYKVNKQKTVIIVNGTSNLHNWETNLKNVDGELSVQLGENNYIEDINALNINFYTNSFNSGKSMMDSKTIEALKSTIYPTINFKLTKISDIKTVNKAEQFTATGNLIIAGVKKEISLAAFGSVSENGELYFLGTKSIDMTDFGIAPPTALLGTLTTGKDVKVTFKLYFL
jgi:polyisoprenoid-binding protein YceI